jgi:hypothetical protein
LLDGFLFLTERYVINVVNIFALLFFAFLYLFYCVFSDLFFLAFFQIYLLCIALFYCIVLHYFAKLSNALICFAFSPFALPFFSALV